MSLLAHLLELRRRLLFALGGIGLGMILAWFAYPFAAGALFAPLDSPGGVSPSGLNLRTVLAPFSMRLAFSAWAGLIATSPWWLAQAWIFIAPAMDRRGRRTALAAALVSALFFLAGASLAWLALPRALSLLLAEAPEGVGTLIDADSYLRFVSAATLIVGLSFTFPVLVVGAHSLGFVRTRALIRHWRWAVMGALTYSAITNPLPDLWSMLLQSAALLGLYFSAVGVCALIDWRRGAGGRPGLPRRRRALLDS